MPGTERASPFDDANAQQLFSDIGSSMMSLYLGSLWPHSKDFERVEELTVSMLGVALYWSSYIVYCFISCIFLYILVKFCISLYILVLSYHFTAKLTAFGVFRRPPWKELSCKPQTALAQAQQEHDMVFV